MIAIKFYIYKIVNYILLKLKIRKGPEKSKFIY